MSTGWVNRIVGHGEEAPDQLLAHPLNFRVHPKHQQDALMGVIADIGYIRSVLVNRRTGHVIDGHLRVALALRDGVPLIPVEYVDLSDAEEAEALATIDPIAALATHDAAKLDDLLREISTDNSDVMMLLDTLATEAGIVPRLPEPGDGGDAFDTTPQEGPTRTQMGDLWQMGRHRLLVGDCTDPANVVRLMNGEKVDAVVTDPPYGIKAGTMTLGTGKRQWHEGNWDEQRPDVRWLLDVASLVCIWGGNYFADQLPISSDWLCWHKKNDGLSFGEFELAWSNLGTNTRHLSHHWSGEVKNHPTQKPMTVMQWCLGLIRGDVIFDPFLGSGTTLIAAERTGRTCYGCEIEPRYADVILRRWEAETGQVAVKAANEVLA